MASPAPSKPPPPPAPASQVRAKVLPRTCLRSLRRYRGAVQAAEIFTRVMDRHGATIGDVSRDLGVSKTIVARMRWPRREFDGRPEGAPQETIAPVHAGDVFAMQRRLALEFLDALRMSVLAANHEEQD